MKPLRIFASYIVSRKPYIVFVFNLVSYEDLKLAGQTIWKWNQTPLSHVTELKLISVVISQASLVKDILR
jgi:hypothetical protein